jgi:hypothetical protein
MFEEFYRNEDNDQVLVAIADTCEVLDGLILACLKLQANMSHLKACDVSTDSISHAREKLEIASEISHEVMRNAINVRRDNRNA